MDALLPPIFGVGLRAKPTEQGWSGWDMNFGKKKKQETSQKSGGNLNEKASESGWWDQCSTFTDSCLLQPQSGAKYKQLDLISSGK